MQCVHINIRQATFIILVFITNHISLTQIDNTMDVNRKEIKKNYTNAKDIFTSSLLSSADLVLRCPSEWDCNKLYPPCIECNLNSNCVYGKELNTTCTAKHPIKCKGPRQFKRSFICRYCYQTEHWEHKCEQKANCNSAGSPPVIYTANCTVSKDILCLGRRTFNKLVKCNWTGGYKWSTALVLSITLGGFGADRFYLGHWQEGIGKLFSFGGLGVWTLIDVILISLHYLGPADGSLYI